MKKITLLLITTITSVIFAQTTIGESSLFNPTSNATWTHVFTAVTTSDGVAVSGLAQTVVIVVINSKVIFFMFFCFSCTVYIQPIVAFFLYQELWLIFHTID